MATQLSTTAFMAKLLAPLPESEEQPSARKFVRQLEADRYIVWRAAEAAADQARREETAAFAAWNAETDKQRKAYLSGARAAKNALFKKAHLKMMLTPAPSHREMRWKRKFERCLEKPECVTAYSRDEALLGPIPQPKPKLRHAA